jgi:hypothetical protein
VATCTETDCPEKEKASSTRACCNYQPTEGEEAHPAIYRGCRHAKEKLQKKKKRKENP